MLRLSVALSLGASRCVLAMETSDGRCSLVAGQDCYSDETSAMQKPVRLPAKEEPDSTASLVALGQGCITQEEIEKSQAAWAWALEVIGREWTGNEPGKVAQDCDAAKAAAQEAIDGAYAYHVDGVKVLFKPTLTHDPETFRGTYDGALSYFVGHCAGAAHIPQDGGFALGANGDDMSKWMGWANVTFHDFTYATKSGPGSSENDSPNCELAVAQGKMTVTSRLTGETTTVDKTFAYMRPPAGSSSGVPLVLTAHHSSLENPVPSPWTTTDDKTLAYMRPPVGSSSGVPLLLTTHHSALENSVPSPPTLPCITQDEIVQSQTAWGFALEAIGFAWTGNKAGKVAQDCDAAKAAALGALDAAYAYHVDGVQVLFKPALAYPRLFRTTDDGVLSYFVGHCAGDDAHIPQDRGFALGANGDDMSKWMGWTNVIFHDFTYQISGPSATDSPNCKLALAQGKMTVTSRLTGETTTLDKTFAYMRPPAGSSSAVALLLTTQHSSLENPVPSPKTCRRRRTFFARRRSKKSGF